MTHILKGAVLGFPVEHSLSPLLHREAYQFLGIEGSYTRQELQLESLHQFFTTQADSFDYFSITMPLKEEALTLPVSVDSVASRIQSANTLYRRGEQWHLTSTDGSGFIAALNNHGATSFKNALVLGAGGTARAVVGALDGVADSITVLGRTSTRREALESSVTTSQFEYVRWIENPEFADFDLVVNTTPAGAADLLADSLSIGSCSLLFDVIYKPWPTVLASRWADCGGEVINGLELLLYQGIEQLSLALNRELDTLSLATHLRPILRKAAK
jgi:shikimate dehydrogenase